MLNRIVFTWIIGAKLIFCSACLNTYTNLGPGFGGSHIYFSGNNTLDECQILCNNDSQCLGYEYETSISFCQLSNNNTGQATGIGTSYFYKRNCCYDAFTSIGNRRRASLGSTFWESAPLSRPDCESLCINYTTCMGFYYNNNDNTCGLSTSSSYFDDFWCSSCHFYARQCPGGCFNTYTTHGPNTKGVGIFYEESSKTNVECEALCNANEICLGFHHNTDDDLCQLAVSGEAVSATTFLIKRCNDCFFYQRHCPKDCLDAYTVVGPYRRGGAVYWENTLTVEDCEASCNADNICQGFAYRTDNSLCQLAISNNAVNYYHCDVCYFHQRQCSGGVSSAALTTTETTTTNAISTHADTTPVVVVNSSVQCACVCVELNITLEEAIEKRKRELTLNVRELSSTKRKYISVDDPRPSARAIGYVGVVFFILLGAFIVLPDLFPVLAFILRRLQLIIVLAFILRRLQLIKGNS